MHTKEKKRHHKEKKRKKKEKGKKENKLTEKILLDFVGPLFFAAIVFHTMHLNGKVFPDLLCL